MQISARNPRESGRDFALRVLKDNILQLELAPGSMVSENELAAQMGLSRTPVREALMALAKVRLVDVYSLLKMIVRFVISCAAYWSAKWWSLHARWPQKKTKWR